MGLDIGTRTSKALIRPIGCAQTLTVEQQTPWRTNAQSGTEIDPLPLLNTSADLIGRAVLAAESAWGCVAVRAVSVTGLGECGVLLDPSHHPRGPAIAWFDRRGQAELGVLGERNPDFVAAFPAMTGLPWSCEASFAKMLWLTSANPIKRGATWLSVPEWVVHGLGGDLVREASLACRRQRRVAASPRAGRARSRRPRRP